MREGPLEVVTLQMVTSTPHRRTLSESYEHKLTPVGELPAVRRLRLKAESGARSRAMQRLQPRMHAQHLQERKRKRDAPVVRCADGHGVGHGVHKHTTTLAPECQQREVERQLQELAQPTGSCRLG